MTAGYAAWHQEYPEFGQLFRWHAAGEVITIDEPIALRGSSGRMLIGIVQGDGEVRFTETFVQMIGQHRIGAVDGLFRGLSDQHHGAVPPGLAGGQRARRANHRSDVYVVPAGMHHSNFLATGILCLDVAGIRHARFLDNRQCVHVGPD